MKSIADESGSFGTRLATARRAKGWTQERLGEFVGMSKQGVCSWEIDRTTPSPEQIKTLCDVLGISADSLLDTAHR